MGARDGTPGVVTGQRLFGGVSTLLPDDPRHGTSSGYSRHRCRCDACRAWSREHYAAQRYREAAGLIREKGWQHGTWSGYNNHGCRCTRCLVASHVHREEQQERREIRRRREQLEAMQQIVREALQDFICPFCGKGPYRSVAGHTAQVHEVTGPELRELAGLLKRASAAGPPGAGRAS